MVIRHKGLLAGVVVFLIAIAAFMFIDTNGNNLDAAQTERAGLEAPVPARIRPFPRKLPYACHTFAIRLPYACHTRKSQ